jgi:hypothetical protein
MIHDVVFASFVSISIMRLACVSKESDTAASNADKKSPPLGGVLTLLDFDS